jgi:hypothetical protein
MQFTKHYNFKYHLIGVISAVVLLGLYISEAKYYFAALWFGLFLTYLLSKSGLTLSPEKFEYKPAPIRNRLFYPVSEIRNVQFVNNQILIAMGNGEQVIIKRKLFSENDLREIDAYFSQYIKNQ